MLHLKYLRFGNKTSLTVACNDVSIIADIDKSLQSLCEGVVVVIEFRVIDNERIKLVSLFETTHFAEERAGRLGGNPESLRQCEEWNRFIVTIDHFADLNGIKHHTEDAEVMSSADVTAQTDRNSFVEICTDRSHAG